jgi:hypothetical protein
MSEKFGRRVFVVLATLLFLIAGCQQKQGDNEAIQAAVRQHLSALGTLNLQAMDVDFTRISVQNNQASADVSFRPKAGAPADATMQVSYQLEKQNGNWKVTKKSAPGGMIEHPDPNVNPHGNAAAGSVHGNLPNFQEILGTNNTNPSNSQQGNSGTSPTSGSVKPQP